MMLRKATHKTRFEAIEVLRFPLVILVVFVHVIPPTRHMVKLSWNMHDIYVLLSELVSHNIGRVAVPCFFLFSGYFFFLKIQSFNASVYAKQLGIKWRTLAVPYLAWTVCFILVVLAKNFAFQKLGMMEDDMYIGLQKSTLYQIFWETPFLYPFWFIRDLICMMILSPIFYLYFKYTKVFGLIPLIIIYLMVWELNIPGLSGTAFLFFGAGAFFGIYNYDITTLGENHKGFKLIAATILLGITVYFNETLYYEYLVRPFTVFGVIAMLCVGVILIKTTSLKSNLIRLSSSVFFIYAIHSIYIINWLKGVAAMAFIMHNGVLKLAAFFIVPIICILICLLLFRFMQVFFPSLLVVFTGNRVRTESKENAHDD